TLGRGSPTAVACYRHAQFPKKYQGGFFAADWTFGRIYFLRLTPVGNNYRCEKEIFLEASGDNGFAPTGMVVHPMTGDLYISIGGRGTRGAVYRVRYKNRPREIDPKQVEALQPRQRKTTSATAAIMLRDELLLYAALAPEKVRKMLQRSLAWQGNVTD